MLRNRAFSASSLGTFQQLFSLSLSWQELLKRIKRGARGTGSRGKELRRLMSLAGRSSPSRVSPWIEWVKRKWALSGINQPLLLGS